MHPANNSSAHIRLTPSPSRERLVELLLEILLTTDDILELVDDPGAGAMQGIVPHVQAVYEQVNGVVNGLVVCAEES